MRTKTTISLLFFCLLNLSAYSQNSFRIRVLDSALNIPIELATIKADGNNYQASIIAFTDSLGFSKQLKNINDSATYIISYIGYKEKKITVITPAEDTVITVSLSPTAQLLSEIIVKGQKAVLERKPDRIIYNINPKNERGMFISDIMRMIPFVVVAGDELLIKGKSNYMILQNGNPSSLTIKDLQVMQPERVKAIEVITSPSARYDGEYESVINIILRDDDNFTGGNFFIKGGNLENSAGLNLAKTNNKANTNFSISASSDKMKSGSDIENVFYSDTPYSLQQNNSSIKKELSLISKFSSEISLPRKQFLGIGAGINLSGKKTDDNYTSVIQNNSSGFVTNDAFLNNNKISDWAADLSANYTKVINDSNTLHFSNLFNFNNSHNRFLSESTKNSFSNNYNNNNIQFSSQVDKEFSLKGAFQCETGLKFIYRNYHLAPYYNDTLSDVFRFHQTIGSAYLSLSKTIKKLYVRSGCRLEGNVNSFDSNRHSSFNLLPNLLLSYTANNNYTLNISGKRNLSRPGFYLLNTFIYKNIPLHTTTGNPALTNEIYNSAEVENLFSWGNNNLSFSLSYTHGGNLISGLRLTDSFTTFMTYANVSHSNAFNSYFSFSRPMFNYKLFLFTSGSVGTYTISDGQQKNNGIIKTINTGLSYNATDKWSFEFSNSYIGNDIFLQASVGNSIFMDVIVHYRYKHSAFLLQATNPVINKISETLKGLGPGFSYAGKDYYFGRSIGIAYSYIFGRQKDVKAKTKDVINNDIKTDEKL